MYITSEIRRYREPFHQVIDMDIIFFGFPYQIKCLLNNAIYI